MEQFELVAVYTKVISKIKPSLQQELETMAIDQAEFGNLNNQEFKELMAVRKMAKSEFRREINWELIKLNNQRVSVSKSVYFTYLILR